MSELNRNEVELSNISLNTSESRVFVKVPRKVLYFSDGVIEEFSDEEPEIQEEPPENKIDTSKLTWGPWILNKVVSTGQTALNACDYVGEGLASFFGITTPKYQLEIDEYNRRVAEEKKRMELQQGWIDPEAKTYSTQPGSGNPTPV